MQNYICLLGSLHFFFPFIHSHPSICAAYGHMSVWCAEHLEMQTIKRMPPPEKSLLSGDVLDLDNCESQFGPKSIFHHLFTKVIPQQTSSHVKNLYKDEKDINHCVNVSVRLEITCKKSSTFSTTTTSVFASKIIILLLKEATMTNLVIVLVSELSLYFFI